MTRWSSPDTTFSTLSLRRLSAARQNSPKDGNRSQQFDCPRWGTSSFRHGTMLACI